MTRDGAQENSRSSIVRNQEWDAPLAQLHLPHFPQFVFRLLGRDAVYGEAALGVVDEAEGLICLFDADNVHEAGGVGGIGADFAVDADEALHDDCFDFAGVEGVLETVGIEVWISKVAARGGLEMSWGLTGYGGRRREGGSLGVCGDLGMGGGHRHRRVCLGASATAR